MEDDDHLRFIGCLPATLTVLVWLAVFLLISVVIAAVML